MPATITDTPYVLKFGSSVLRGPADVPLAVSEIYRHLRLGRRVVAVVSAFRGRTDTLIAHAAACDLDANSPAAAGVIGLGEAETAALLAAALGNAGLPASLLDWRTAGLRATETGTNAGVAGVDAAAVRGALAHGRVAVVPGYVAAAPDGSPAVLGRGGSDLTAVALGAALDAEVHLIKDVGGVYERDPAVAADAPGRYQGISYADALVVGRQAVQPRAVEHAEKTAVRLSVVAPGSDAGTSITRKASRLAAEGHRLDSAPERPVRIALLGIGTVGLGVARRLAREPRRHGVEIALVRDAAIARPGLPPTVRITDHPDDAFATDPDVVIELIGGTTLAADLVERALAGGRSVVTANKALIASDGARLHAIAREHGAQLLHSAAVGGALPAIELVRAARERGPIASIRAVLNGTCNDLLNRTANAGTTPVGLEEAIRAAQLAGYAEADPSLDLSGDDAAQKLAILAREAFGLELDPALIEREPLTDEVISRSIADGPLRQIARVDSEGRASVRFESATDRLLAELPGAWNAIEIALADGSPPVTAAAAGAGRWPTTEAVVADVAELVRAASDPHRADRTSAASDAPLATPAGA